MGINLIGQRDSILTSEGEQRVFDPTSQPQTATGEYLPLCRRTGGDIGEVASLRAEGVDRQPRSGFSASLAKLRR